MLIEEVLTEISKLSNPTPLIAFEHLYTDAIEPVVGKIMADTARYSDATCNFDATFKNVSEI